MLLASLCDLEILLLTVLSRCGIRALLLKRAMRGKSSQTVCHAKMAVPNLLHSILFEREREGVASVQEMMPVLIVHYCYLDVGFQTVELTYLFPISNG